MCLRLFLHKSFMLAGEGFLGYMVNRVQLTIPRWPAYFSNELWANCLA